MLDVVSFFSDFFLRKLVSELVPLPPPELLLHVNPLREPESQLLVLERERLELQLVEVCDGAELQGLEHDALLGARAGGGEAKQGERRGACKNDQMGAIEKSYNQPLKEYFLVHHILY